MIKLGSRNFNIVSRLNVKQEINKLSRHEQQLLVIATDNYAHYIDQNHIKPMSPYKFLKTNEWLNWIQGWNA